jgi:hypothetical protein
MGLSITLPEGVEKQCDPFHLASRLEQEILRGHEGNGVAAMHNKRRSRSHSSSTTLFAEKFGDGDAQCNSEALNIVQPGAVFRILDFADLILGQLGRVSQIFLAHFARNPQTAHLLRQDSPCGVDVPPCHLHGRPLDLESCHGTFSMAERNWMTL